MANNKKLYVGNLSHDLNNNDLKEAFEPYGEGVSAQIIMDRDTGRSKGFGFVEMGDNDQAQAAIDGLNGTEVAGRALTVNEARPQTDRGGRPSVGGGGRSGSGRPGGGRGFGGGGGGGNGGGRRY